MMGLFIAAVQQAAAEPFPFWQLTAFVILAAGVLMVLIRAGLRKPPELATIVETNMLTEELRRFREEMSRDISSFRDELRSIETDYKDTCASRRDLDVLGEKVDRIDKFNLAVHDRSIEAFNTARQAVQEAAQIRADMSQVRTDVRQTRDLMLELRGMLNAGGGRRIGDNSGVDK